VARCGCVRARPVGLASGAGELAFVAVVVAFIALVAVMMAVNPHGS
jgi:hypothetical protein